MTEVFPQPLAFVGLLVFLRVGAACWAMPALGGTAIPGPARLIAAAAITVAFTPPIAAGLSLNTGGEPLVWIGLALREVFVGSLLGFIAGLGLWAAQAAGALVEDLPEGEGPVGRLTLMLAMVLLFATGAHRIVLGAFAESYRALPLAQSAFATSGMVERVIEATASFWVAALMLAAPLLLVGWLTELALGISSRLLGQAQGMLLLAPTRSLVLLAALLVFALGLAGPLSDIVANAARRAQNTAQELGK